MSRFVETIPTNDKLFVKLLEIFSGGPPYDYSRANDQNFGFCFFRELKLVLAATSAKVNGSTSTEYYTALCKFFQVSKGIVSFQR